MRGQTPSRELDTLQINFQVHGDRVTATAHALTAARDNPERYSDANKHKLGVHSARLNQTITLNELEHQNAVFPRPVSHPPVAEWWRRQPSVRTGFFQ
jgi:hypothetical protein